LNAVADFSLSGLFASHFLACKQIKAKRALHRMTLIGTAGFRYRPPHK
jgi:hypothetical protein